MLKFRENCVTPSSLNSVRLAMLILALNVSAASAASDFNIVEPPSDIGMVANNLGVYDPVVRRYSDVIIMDGHTD